MNLSQHLSTSSQALATPETHRKLSKVNITSYFLFPLPLAETTPDVRNPESIVLFFR